MVVDEYHNVLTDSNSKKDLDPIFLEYALPFFLLVTSLILRKCFDSLCLSLSLSLLPHLPMCVCTDKHEVMRVCVGSYL